MSEEQEQEQKPQPQKQVVVSDGVDLVNRDPFTLNLHLRTRYEEIFAEPDSAARSIDCVWRCSYKCMNGTLSCCYKFLTVLCAIPIAFCWACEFACLACFHVWYWTPNIKYLTMNLVPARKLMWIYLDTYYGPCCEICATCCSGIDVTNKNG